MKFYVGDMITGVDSHNNGMVVEITAVRESGYSWKYPKVEQEFHSEDSSDPFFEWGWEKVD